MSDAIDDVKKTPLRPKQKWTMALLGVVILVSGFVLGASTSFFVLQNKVVRPPDPRPKADPDLAKRIKEKFGLSEEQDTQVKTLMDELHTRFLGLRTDFMEAMRENREEMVAKMKSILTPEQFEQWEKDFKRHDRFRGRGRGDGRRRGGPGRGPRPDGEAPDEGPRHRGPGLRDRQFDHRPGPPRESEPNRSVEPEK